MPVSNKEFLDIQATIECGFILKHACDMTRTYSQMHCRDKYSQHSSIIWPVWLDGWVFVYELSGCGFESYCNHNIWKLYFDFNCCEFAVGEIDLPTFLKIKYCQNVRKKDKFLYHRKKFLWDLFTKYIRTETAKIFILVAIWQNDKENKLHHFCDFNLVLITRQVR